MIPAVCWIPRGAARERPVKYEISAEELSRIKVLAKEEEEIEKENNAEESEEVDISDLPPELNMDKYDEDSDVDMDDDDHLVLMDAGDRALAIEADSEDEDAEDDQIRNSDSLLVVAITEDEYSHLEVQLLDDEGNMYVHHDIALPEFPLCLSWMDCPPFAQTGESQSFGNYMAVGTFDPSIEIWNLDVLDVLEPSAILGGLNQDDSKAKKKKKAKKKAPTYKAGSHQDAVMALSWNRNYRQALASGSADKTVKIWDVTTQQCTCTFTHHADKVQSVQFHPDESWLLASGGFDRSVAFIDCRNAGIASNFKLSSDIEAMTWNPFSQYHLYASLEDGKVCCMDVRKNDSPLFQFQAHDKTTSALSFSSSVPGMLATVSIDKSVRIWDMMNAEMLSGTNQAPPLVAYKSLNVGKLFTVQFYPNNPYMLAAAGDKGLVAVWESDEMDVVVQRFQGRIDASKEPTYQMMNV